MTCPRCRTELGGAAICPQCGLAVQGEASPTDWPAAPLPGQYPSISSLPPVAMATPRPIRGLGAALSAMLAVVVLLDVAAIAIAIHRRSLFERIIADGDYTLSEAEASDAAWMVLGITQAALFVAAATVWLIWFYRARSNAEFYGPVLRHDKGWAIAAWLVPFLNLARPKGITDDIARASAPGVPFSLRDIFMLPKNRLITVWWTAWLVDLGVDRLLFNQYRQADDITDEPRVLVFEMLVSVIDIIAAVLAILVVRVITANQEQKNALFAHEIAWSGVPPIQSTPWQRRH